MAGDLFRRAYADLVAATDWAGDPGRTRPDEAALAAGERWRQHSDACRAEGLCPFCGAQLKPGPYFPQCPACGYNHGPYFPQCPVHVLLPWPELPWRFDPPPDVM